MPSKFRLERFEPVEIERAQEVVDRHLKEALDFKNTFETDLKKKEKKSFIQKLLAWFR